MTVKAAELKNQAVLTLLRRQPFMFHLITQLRYEETDSVPTAAVVFDGLNNESWLKVNPDFVEKLSALELEGLLAHELLHVMHEHTHSPHVREWTWNIATDLAVNTVLLKQGYVLPEGGLTPEGVATKLAEDLGHPVETPPGLMSAYWYYRWLQENAKTSEDSKDSCGGGKSETNDTQDNQKPGENQSGSSLQEQADPHGHWSDSEGQQSPEARELTKRMVAQHVQKASERAAGRLPGYLDSLVNELLRVLEEPSLRWNQALKRFVGFRAGVSLKASCARTNKYGQIPKILFKPSTKFMVFIDVSGSVDDELAAKFFSELEGLAKQGNEFDLAQFSIDVVPTGRFTKKPYYSRFMKGGTDFSAPFKFMLKNRLYNKYDGVIVLTDGEAPWPTPDELLLPSLWVLSAEQTTPAHINTIVIKD
jgi:predicted metal-dependent peptidase